MDADHPFPPRLDLREFATRAEAAVIQEHLGAEWGVAASPHEAGWEWTAVARGGALHVTRPAGVTKFTATIPGVVSGVGATPQEAIQEARAALQEQIKKYTRAQARVAAAVSLWNALPPQEPL